MIFPRVSLFLVCLSTISGEAIAQSSGWVRVANGDYEMFSSDEQTQVGSLYSDISQQFIDMSFVPSGSEGASWLGSDATGPYTSTTAGSSAKWYFYEINDGSEWKYTFEKWVAGVKVKFGKMRCAAAPPIY